MNRSFLRRVAISFRTSAGAVLAAGFLCGAFSSTVQAQSVTIAPMTWTPRSDWVNVKTDPALTVHAVGDGVTDDTAALQQAMSLVSTPLDANFYSLAKKTVYLPPGTYKISSTLSWNVGVNGITGLSLIGCGSGTTIAWYGASGGTMLTPILVARARYMGIRWDGRNLAATAISHVANGAIAEFPVRHFNEAFLNFTGVALACNGDATTRSWTGGVEVWNCLFYHCNVGAQIGLNQPNFYEYLFEKCEFEQCHTGIDNQRNTALMVYDTHFDHSSTTDMAGYYSLRARHCTSTRSTAFFVSPTWSGSAASMHVFQDCWVDSWANTASGTGSGAIQLGDRLQAIVFDCKFTNPPNGAPPINLTCPNYSKGPGNLLVSNNSCPGFSSQSAMVQLSGANPFNVLEVPPGSASTGITSVLDSANVVFLDSTPIVDSPHILDVTLPPYNAATDATVDAQPAIQAAIDDARAANDGTIVYLPAGYYAINTPLNVSGGNYKVQGCGFYSQLCWNGADNSTVVSVTTPSNVAVENLMVKVAPGTPNTAGITETATGPSQLLVDWVWFGQEAGAGSAAWLKTQAADYGGKGLVLSELPAGSVTYLPYWNGPLYVHDCGAAEILGNHVNGGQVIVDGATHPKTGFLGFLYGNVGFIEQLTSLYDVSVLDSQDVVFGDFYNEQTYNNLDLEGGSATWSGRVTIQAFKQQDWNDSIAVNINDYKGRLFYGPQYFLNVQGGATSSPTVYLPTRIAQIGANPIDLILPMDSFIGSGAAPDLAVGTSCNVIQAYSKAALLNGVDTLLPNNPNPLTTASLTSMAAGLDHLRQLGMENLKLVAGLDAVTPIFADSLDSLSGGTRALGAISTIVGTDPLTGTSGLYLHAHSAAGSPGRPPIATYTPAAMANSWAALAGSTTVGGVAYTTLNGAFDLFVCPNAVDSASGWFRPVDVTNISGTTGMRIILNTAGAGQLQCEVVSGSAAGLGSAPGVFTTNNSWLLSGGITNIPDPFTPGAIAHIGVTFNTDATTGRITMKVFGVPGVGAIDTTSGANLLATQSFYASAAAIGASPLPAGAWTMTQPSSATMDTDVDYDEIRLYNADPGSFPSLPLW